MKPALLSRRRALQTLFCSSAALALNIRPGRAAAEISKEALHVLMVGDFGTGAADQLKVAAGMKKFAADKAIKTEKKRKKRCQALCRHEQALKHGDSVNDCWFHAAMK